jgi:hypothetical protein
MILDLLSNSELRHVREWYGTPGSKKVGLSTKSDVNWPPNYVPNIAGYEFSYLDPDEQRDRSTSRVLGITIHHFAFPAPAKNPDKDLFQGYPIAIGLFNIGGEGNGSAPGGCLVYYSIKQTESKQLTVEYEGSLDP